MLVAVSLTVSVVAVLLSAFTWHSTRKEDVYQYLSGLWNDTLSSCLANPSFLDVATTEKYHRGYSDRNRSGYEIYCYKAWSQVEAIIAKGFHTDPKFKAIIAWNAAYNGHWIQRNPTFFESEQFWTVVDSFREAPQIVLRHRPLPRLADTDDIDWDRVCDDYYSYVLSPFAPEMVARDKGTGKMRNLLLAELLDMQWGRLRGARLADFGCGPGNLIQHLGGRVQEITGIDRSAVALARAARVAGEQGINFHSVNQDLRDLQLKEEFDLIISSNSILPRHRNDVVKILTGIRNRLSPAGRFYGILPAYDATIYLRELWQEHYTNVTGDSGHAARIVKSLREKKMANDEESSYADDGQSPQCYHTQQTILREFEAAGLHLLQEPIKVKYPWELANRFDYGYFPKAREEIWDWFIVAGVAPVRQN